MSDPPSPLTWLPCFFTASTKLNKFLLSVKTIPPWADVIILFGDSDITLISP